MINVKLTEWINEPWRAEHKKDG